MTHEPLEPLDPALASLLDTERRAAPPPDALGRIWSRVLLAPPMAIAPAVPPPVTPAAHGWLATHALGVAAVAFVTGAATGAAVYAVTQPKPLDHIVYVDRPVSPPTQAPIPAPAPAPTLNPAPAPIPASAPQPSSAATPTAAPSSSSLFAERTLLDRARNALASHDPATALTLLADHAHRFPRAQLAEERDALDVQSLVALGRYDDARAAAARFKAKTPGSLFLPAIEASLASIP